MVKLEIRNFLRIIHEFHISYISLCQSVCHKIVLVTEVDQMLTTGGIRVVNCPTRWSLLFIFGFLCWSSSWWWWPHIGGGKKFRPLLRAGLTVLVQFFCKMYILWVSWSRKKNLADFFLVLPPQTRRFFQRGPKCQNGGLAHFFEQPPFLTFFSLRL